jgi:hypothetical protein
VRSIWIDTQFGFLASGVWTLILGLVAVWDRSIAVLLMNYGSGPAR